MVNYRDSYLIRLAVVILVINVAFFVTQSGCEFAQTLEAVIEDKGLSKTITDYLDNVPTSHKARSHANRILSLNEPLVTTIKKTTVKKTTHIVKNFTKTTTISYSQKSYSNKITEIVQIILSLDKKSSEPCPECSPCPTKKPCPKNCKEPCPNKSCPPCKLPDFCVYPVGRPPCPEKPSCQICPGDPSLPTTTTKKPKVPTTGSSKTLVAKPSTKPPTKPPTKPSTKPTKAPAKSPEGSSSKKPASVKTDVGSPPPIIMEEIKALMEAEKTSNTTVTNSSEESSNSTTTTTEEVSKQTPKTRKKRGEVGNTYMKDLETPTEKPAQKPAKNNKKTTARPAGSAKSTTAPPTKPGASKSTVKPAVPPPKAKTGSPPKKHFMLPTDIKHGPNKIEVSKNVTKDDHNLSESSKNDGKGNTSHNKTESRKRVSSQFHGVLLFHDCLDRIDVSESTRDSIFKMLENIPSTNGGQDSLIADKILARFGEKDIKLLKKKGSTREYTTESARTKLMAIIGHILDKKLRKKCDCPKCEPIVPCNCTICPYSTSGCAPCKATDCIYPDGCAKHPPCPKCTQVDDPDDDGKLSELDDIDTTDPVAPGELDKPFDCKDGATCPKTANFTCGGAPLNPLTPKTNSSEYMVGGEDIKYGEYPQFVRIEVKVSGKILNGLCGGTLISRTHVITAGHCTQIKEPGSKRNYTKFKPENFKIILGDFKRREKDKYEEERSVKHITYSSKFNIPDEEGSRYDYAILTLDKPVKFNNYIQPACLPYEPLNIKPNTICHVVGVGITKFDKKSGLHEFAKAIQKMRLRRTSCKSWGFKHDDRSRHCFTKFGAKGDTCGGDSGGPVLCLDHKNRWTLMGMVSYGAEACDGSETTGWVAVYSRIKALMSLIKKDSHSQNPENFI